MGLVPRSEIAPLGQVMKVGTQERKVIPLKFSMRLGVGTMAVIVLGPDPGSR